jgi:hypothetical protein
MLRTGIAEMSRAAGVFADLLTKFRQGYDSIEHAYGWGIWAKVVYANDREADDTSPMIWGNQISAVLGRNQMIPSLTPDDLCADLFLNPSPLDTEADLHRSAAAFLEENRLPAMFYACCTGPWEQPFELFKELARAAGEELQLVVREALPLQFEPMDFIDRWLSLLWWSYPPSTEELISIPQYSDWHAFENPFLESADAIERCRLDTEHPVFSPKHWPRWAGKCPGLSPSIRTAVSQVAANDNGGKGMPPKMPWQTAEELAETEIQNDPVTSPLKIKVTAYGDWHGHLNRVDGYCSARIHAAWSTLDGKARQRGFAYASIGEKRKAAFAEVELFITDAVAWCHHDQERGTSISSPFTEQREAEVIAAVRRFLDGIVTWLTEANPTEKARRSVQNLYDVHEVHCEQNLIRPRFYDGRADFRPMLAADPDSQLATRGDILEDDISEETATPGRKPDILIAQRDSRIREVAQEHGITNEWARLAKLANDDPAIKALKLERLVTRDIARNVIEPPKKRGSN